MMVDSWRATNGLSSSTSLNPVHNSMHRIDMRAEFIFGLVLILASSCHDQRGFCRSPGWARVPRP